MYFVGDRESLVIFLDTGHISVEICHSIPPRLRLITGAAETNIVVRIARDIVQIQRERPGVVRVIPIAAT